MYEVTGRANYVGLDEIGEVGGPIQTRATCNSRNLVPSVMLSIWRKLEIVCPLE
jgi:hypothetical protein